MVSSSHESSNVVSEASSRSKVRLFLSLALGIYRTVGKDALRYVVLGLVSACGLWLAVKTCGSAAASDITAFFATIGSRPSQSVGHVMGLGLLVTCSSFFLSSVHVHSGFLERNFLRPLLLLASEVSLASFGFVSGAASLGVLALPVNTWDELGKLLLYLFGMSLGFWGARAVSLDDGRAKFWAETTVGQRRYCAAVSGLCALVALWVFVVELGPSMWRACAEVLG